MLDLYARFAPFFPIGDGMVRLEVVEPWGPLTGAPDRTVVVVRLIVLEEHEGQIRVRDVKEQEVYAGHPTLYDDTSRVDEMLYAQQDVLGEVLRSSTLALDTLMPHELLFTNVLSLVRARSREDFARALRAKSRLGRYLGK
jgi:hypothetical protein